MRENDWRELETRSHHLESLRQTVINPLLTFRDSQERIRKRVKQDVKASSTDYEEGSRNLKASKRSYEKRCEEMELVKAQQQAIEDQRTLLSPPNREASLDGRSNSSSHHSPESSASGSAEPIEIANSSTSTSPQLKPETLDTSAGSPGDKKHFLIDALRSKEGWEAARKEAPRKFNALINRMREGGVGSSTSNNAGGGGDSTADSDYSSGALGLGQGPGSLRSSQNIALKQTKAKREVEEAEKIYR